MSHASPVLSICFQKKTTTYDRRKRCYAFFPRRSGSVTKYNIHSTQIGSTQPNRTLTPVRFSAFPFIFLCNLHGCRYMTLLCVKHPQLGHTGRSIVGRSAGAPKRVRQISFSSVGLAAGDSPQPSGSNRPTQDKAQTTASSSGSSSSQSSTHDNPITAASSAFQLNIVHVALFTTIFIGGAFFATLTLQASIGIL